MIEPHPQQAVLRRWVVVRVVAQFLLHWFGVFNLRNVLLVSRKGGVPRHGIISAQHTAYTHHMQLDMDAGRDVCLPNLQHTRDTWLTLPACKAWFVHCLHQYIVVVLPCHTHRYTSIVSFSLIPVAHTLVYGPNSNSPHIHQGRLVVVAEPDKDSDFVHS